MTIHKRHLQDFFWHFDPLSLTCSCPDSGPTLSTQAPCCKCHGCKVHPSCKVKICLGRNGLNFYIVILLACKFRNARQKGKNFLNAKLLLGKLSADCSVNNSDLELCKCSTQNILLKIGFPNFQPYFQPSLLQPNEPLLRS